MTLPTSSPAIEAAASSAERIDSVPRIYIVSDVRLYREGLISSLTRHGHLRILGAGSACNALEQIIRLRPQVLLLDLSVRDSFALPRRAQELVPALRVVAFAVEELEENILACARAGICGYVPQDGSTEDVVAAIVHALKGELLCSPRIAAHLLSRVAALPDNRAGAPIHVLLTRRERQVAALLACDFPNKEIARRLHLAPATIKNHVHNILQKLNVHRRGDVAAAAVPEYGVPPQPAMHRSTATEVPIRFGGPMSTPPSDRDRSRSQIDHNQISPVP
jgi:two-component system nitrate/nitrite response regulator NarL